MSNFIKNANSNTYKNALVKDSKIILAILITVYNVRKFSQFVCRLKLVQQISRLRDKISIIGTRIFEPEE